MGDYYHHKDMFVVTHTFPCSKCGQFLPKEKIKNQVFWVASNSSYVKQPDCCDPCFDKMKMAAIEAAKKK